MAGQGSNRAPDWTKEEDDKLRGLWADGVATSDLAPVFGRNPGAVRARAHRLGLARPPKIEAPKPVKPKRERTHPLKPGLLAKKPEMMRFGAISIPKSRIAFKRGAPERLVCEPVTLEDRRRDQCGWPVNDGGPYLFCGAPKARKYCAYHDWLGNGRLRPQR